jgi:hypothetical protein
MQVRLMVIDSKYKGQALNCFKDMVMNDALHMFITGTFCRFIGTMIFSSAMLTAALLAPVYEQIKIPGYYLNKSFTLGLGMVLAYPWFFIADNVCYARFHNS